jgi:hypothetical protein
MKTIQGRDGAPRRPRPYSGRNSLGPRPNNKALAIAWLATWRKKYFPNATALSIERGTIASGAAITIRLPQAMGKTL